MFDNEIVCLGNSITAVTGASYDPYDTNTTLNQCNLIGDVVVSENGINTVTLATADEHPYSTAPKWVLHDNIGYVFPNGGNVVVSNKTQHGNWHDINNNGTDAGVSRDVFSMWFNHGKKVNNGSYSYIIVPNKNAAEMKNYFESGNVEILENNTSLQAVHHKTLGMLGIIFYSSSVSFTGGGISVEVNRPCVLLLKKKNGHIEMHIADPAQSQTQINVKIKNSSSTDWVTTSCNFAGTGDYKGASKAYYVPVSGTGIKVTEVEDPVIDVQYYDLLGKETLKPSVEGIYILKKMHQSKKVTASKEFISVKR